MEAARLIPRVRGTARLDRELDDLRPFGEAYLMRNFGEQLAHADAEDAVSDVTLRLHRQIAAGHPPDNLQAAFLTGCRNAAIDRLRLRARKPTVAIEAAVDTPTDLPPPDELAERGDASARTRELLARLRPRQRRVLMLRFGADLTVPEIAEQMQISLPAAKNLLGRSVEQARRRFEAIEGREFCSDIQGLLRGAVIDRQLAELASEDERKALEAHLDHCGVCKSFLSDLHRDLHEIGSGAVLSAAAIHGGARLRPGAWLDHALNGLHGVIERTRLAAYKLSGALGGDSNAAGGALAGTGQKVAAICGAATATTATCLATGLVGPGVGVLDHHQSEPVVHHAARAARVHHLSELAPASPEPQPEATPEPAPQLPSGSEEAPTAQQSPATEPEPTPTPSEQGAEEFGVESSAPPPEAEPAPPPAPSPPPPSSSKGSAGGGESFGFGG
jgi:RNA polymerase sigma factor (sigma-70 family)